MRKIYKNATLNSSSLFFMILLPLSHLVLYSFLMSSNNPLMPIQRKKTHSMTLLMPNKVTPLLS